MRLFSERGIHATGIDTILAESGVAKATLYAHFGSKTDLIVAALQTKGTEWARWLAEESRKRGESPRDRVLGFFDVLERWFAMPEFRGCLFLRAAGEFAELDDPVHRAASEAKRAALGVLADLLRGFDAEGATELEAPFALLVEGAIIMAQLRGSPQPARDAKRAASLLLDARAD